MTTIENLQELLTTPVYSYSGISMYQLPVEHIHCADGTSLSVQATENHYCTPQDNVGPYSHVEVWCVTATVTEFEYDDECPSAYVPIEDVAAFIDNHGGIAK